MRLLSLSGAYLLPVFVLVLHSVMDVLAMPVDGGPSTNDNLATPIARPVKNSQALNLYFQILHEDLGTTRPHFALWMTSSICLSVLKDKPNEDKPNVVKREDKVVKEHHKLKFKSYQMGKPLETHSLLGSGVYWLGTFYYAKGSKETLLTQLESLREKDEISLFLMAWTFASTASHPDPVIFHPAAHNPSRLPLIFLSAMTRPDDFPVHYGLPAESWRAVAAETPLQTQERMKPPKEEALKNFNSRERVKLTSTSNTATPNELGEPPAIVHETWDVTPPY